MRSRAAAARLPSSSTNSCKSDTSRHNSLGWELRCRRRRRRRRAAPWLGNTHHTFVSQSKQKIIYARMRHCVASGRGGGSKAAAALLIDFGNYAWQIRATLRYSPTLTCPQSFEWNNCPIAPLLHSTALHYRAAATAQSLTSGKPNTSYLPLW